MGRWVKILPKGDRGWLWVPDSTNGVFQDDLTGNSYRRSEISILDVAEAPTQEALDWRGSILTTNPCETYGWLSPEGRHFLCGTRLHEPCARVVIRMPEEVLETQGWLKVFSPISEPAWLMSPTQRVHGPTQAQIDWLFDHGFKLDLSISTDPPGVGNEA